METGELNFNDKENPDNAVSDEADIFCFESDHVALKGNPDYQEMLKTFALLEAQRTKAIQDLDELIRCREDALADPISFVHKLQNNVDLGLPRPQTLAELPDIDWHKYSSGLDSSQSSTHKHKTRFTTKRQRDEPGSNISSRSTTPTLEMPPSVPGCSGEDVKPLNVVRGKMKDPTKPQTFNKPWSAEEQKKLEELLIKYPPEAVEARRWEKIASELGDRTKHQVQSRIQKYFIRLAKDGLPIPGRIPNMRSVSAQRRHAHQRYNRFLYPESTMYASYRPPVYMSDDEDSSSYYGVYMSQKPVGRQSTHSGHSSLDVSDEDDIPCELRDSEEYRELLRLKRERKGLHTSQPVRHLGYKCDACGSEPICGTRWHCTDCPQDLSTDFCDECYDLVHESGCHKSSHRLEVVHSTHTEQHHDTDYTHSQFIPGDYNYLDPNYMPAS